MLILERNAQPDVVRIKSWLGHDISHSFIFIGIVTGIGICLECADAIRTVLYER